MVAVICSFMSNSLILENGPSVLTMNGVVIVLNRLKVTRHQCDQRTFTIASSICSVMTFGVDMLHRKTSTVQLTQLYDYYSLNGSSV